MEGEFLDGEYWKEKGQKYFMNCYLIYEGEFINGKRNGKGKTFRQDELLEFEYEFLNGKE